MLVHPGLGLVYAGFALPAAEDPRRARRDPAAASTRVAARRGRGRARGGAGVGQARARRLRDLAGALPLARALKQRFDPDGLLNPGRFAGYL